MNLLILGLVIFLGVHSVRVFAAPWRDATRARLGEGEKAHEVYQRFIRERTVPTGTC